MANISSDPDHFFQSDADVERQKARAAKYNYDIGDPIKIGTKVLALKIVDDGANAYIAEAGFVARKINLKVGPFKQLGIILWFDLNPCSFCSRHTNYRLASRSKSSRATQGPSRRSRFIMTPTASGSLPGRGTKPSKSGTPRYAHLTSFYLICSTPSIHSPFSPPPSQTQECVATYTAHSDFVKSLIVVRRTLYSGSSDRTIRQWDLVTGACVRTLQGHSRGIEDFAVSEDGAYLYSASSDRSVRKWEIASGRCEAVLEGHETSVYAVRVLEGEMWTGELGGGKIMGRVASADKFAKRWNLDIGQPDTSFEHPDYVRCLVIAGPYLFTGARDEIVRVWEIGSGKLVTTIEGHFDEVICMEVHGNTLYTGSLDCSIRKWPITTKELFAFKAEVEKKAKEGVEPQEEERKIKDGVAMTEEEERELAELMGSDDEL
ncbi:WD40-repeat-containing domain protein [Jimgerdemannia flammicorona]|uniref:WD40-repeat-containing domain protein n=1 Tax=Jimgerdemannia flammicorona TaxID=994334 RepID=A0A433PZM3_9FUNG|nr:WD40-repeat-containing domain protein [Jimgerdemannia flammicorona]